MKFGPFMQKWGVLAAFLVLLGLNIVMQPQVFLKPDVLRNLFSQNCGVGIIAVGMTLLIVSGGIDLSVGSLMALAGGVGIMVMNKSLEGHAPEMMAVWTGVGASILVSVAGGLVNGLLVTVGRIAPFVATLGGLLAYRSLTQAIADGSEIASKSTGGLESLAGAGLPLPFIMGSNHKPLMVQWIIFVFLLAVVAATFLLERTPFGRRLVAVGANEKAAVYAAVSVNAVKLGAYAIVGLCVGIASVIGAAKLNSISSSSMGAFYELDAIAAVVIGGTSLSGGRGRVWGTLIGVLLLGMISTMLVTANVSIYWQGVVKGVIILLAVLIQRGQKAA
ncbi:MAG: ABC transporter permease [Armatimonadetes bacterium]|nr:ABC transporter permease [Armatimonadota bacterium]